MTTTEQQYRQRITIGDKGNTLIVIIAINLIVFVSLAFMKAVWLFKYQEDQKLGLVNYTQNILGLFALPADGDKLLSKPWTVITHMFSDDQFWRVFANMLWLWAFGTIMQDLTGKRKVAPVFIYGALAGAAAFLLAYNFIPSLRQVLSVATSTGASAGVMAVAIATTMLSPRYKLFPLIGGGIPLWVLTTIYVASDLLPLSIGDTGTLITHLAGAAMGFVFVVLLRSGTDLSNGMSNFFDWVTTLFNPNKPKKGTDIKKELFYKSTSTPYKKTPNVTQQRIDEILDKINQQGYDTLTDDEKELLQRASKEGL
jgi:membrane associated rhomboid family serine protease